MRRPQKIALQGGPVTIAGALDVERTATGLIPQRLPAWALPRIMDSYMRIVAPRPSGVRLVFRTDADGFAIDALVTRFRNAHFPLSPVGFDLVVDRDRVISRPADRGDLCVVGEGRVTEATEGRPETIRFDGLGDGWKDIEVWLPQAAIVELRELRVEGDVEPGRLPDRRWIHYGSSISHCTEAYGPARTWPAYVARRAELDLMSLAFSGCCHLDPFVARTIRDLPAAFISLKVGINVLNADSLKIRTFVPALHGFLDTVREGHPDTPVLVVSPIICPTAEDRAGPTVQDGQGRYVALGEPSRTPDDASLSLRRMRALIEEIIAVRAASDPKLRYLDGLSLFGPDDAVDLYDGLHPNADGYLRIGERFFEHAFGRSGLLSEIGDAST